VFRCGDALLSVPKEPALEPGGVDTSAHPVAGTGRRLCVSCPGQSSRSLSLAAGLSARGAPPSGEASPRAREPLGSQRPALAIERSKGG
jgi:hypothetical protein